MWPGRTVHNLKLQITWDKNYTGVKSYSVKQRVLCTSQPNFISRLGK